MMQVGDLRLKEEVLPCFDYTNNRQSALRLLSLLEELPSTESEVLERQAITQGFIGNWAVLENFTYRRLDLVEVHAFFESSPSSLPPPGDGKLKASLRLMWSETERIRLRSNLVQTVLLLNGIYVQYWNRLNKEAFPSAFQARIRNAFSFLGKLNLEAYAHQITADRFTVTKMVELSQRINSLNQSEVKSFWDFFFTFEAYWSIAKGTLANGFAFPALGSTALKIEGFYHPAVKEPVRNTLEMGMEQNVLLLTGPNMSGKSTMLKAVGLCVYLARAGFAVPASSCELPFFDSIAIAVNLNDSLQDGYSHFMAEVMNLKSVLGASEGEGRCFAVFDEIFRGTNVDDALEITQATVEGIVKRKGSFFLISTHILQLDEQLDGGSTESVKKCFIECTLDMGSPKFSYLLKEGWSQLKIGKILFDKEGLMEMLAPKNKNGTIQQCI